MNQDPVYQKYREISWRRPLTAAEQAELKAWLLAHPEAQTDADLDALLTAALTKLPDAPVPSNFTSQVLQAIERESHTTPAAKPLRSWWQVWLPRLAPACAVLLGGVLVWQNHRQEEQRTLAQVAREVASADILSDPNVMSHFDEIVSLTSTSAAPDEGLLAMSEDLIALSK